ncbi:MAG: aminoacetone oxidase family FAD-binding enzyme [Minisyncoccia bacterium]
MNSLQRRRWDVVVIGGGPAGMMAAGRAAEKGARVILIEKNPKLGKKLLITGGGRCNVANAEFDTRLLLQKYTNAGKYLASPFASWGAKESIDFFESRSMPTKTEAEKRVFPVSNSAQSVHDCLTAYMKEGGVTISTKSTVVGIVTEKGVIVSVKLKDGTLIDGTSFILATGGASRPETGSTGDGFEWLRELGHTVSVANAALVPISVHDSWVKRAAGVSLKDVKISLFQFEKKEKSMTGKILFTHEGLSGPGILNMSRDIGEYLQYGDVALEIDLLPESGYEKVNAALQEIFKANATKMLKNSLRTLIPPALVPIILELAKIGAETTCTNVSREERVRLMKLVKHVPLSVKGLLGLDKAVVTSGGVILDEIDTKSMRSRLVPNLFLVGDILDVNRPSGGFSLQLCWATGQVAGESAYTASI